MKTIRTNEQIKQPCRVQDKYIKLIPSYKYSESKTI